MTLSRLLCIAALGFAGAPACAQNIIFVDDSAPPAGDGSSWQTAHRFLTDAIEHASNTPGADEIRIAEGFYWPDESEANPAGTGDLCAAFELPDSAAHGITKLIGGYRGTGTPGDPNQRDPELFESVLTGDLLGNDPAWPFTGYEPEWGDNARILILANTRRVHIEGLVLHGAYSTSLVTEFGYDFMIDPVYTESVLIRDTSFRNTPTQFDYLNCINSNTQIVGTALNLRSSSNHIFPTDAELYNVSFEHIGNEQGGLAFQLGRGTTHWLGGGITNSQARSFILSDSNDVEFVRTWLHDLTFENLDVAGGHVFHNARDVPTSIERCLFRNIMIDRNGNTPFGEIPSIITLYNYQDFASPDIPKVVRDCTFETLGDPEDEDISAGAVVSAATLVEGCAFVDIHNHLGAVVYAREIRHSTFDNVTIPISGFQDPADIDFETLFGIEYNLLTDHRVALVRDASGLAFRNISVPGAVLEVVSTASDCEISDSAVANSFSNSNFAGPVVAYTDTVLNRLTVKNNIYGDPNVPAEFGDNGSAGVLLYPGAELHHSLIEGNRIYSTSQSRFIGTPGAIQMYQSSKIYNSVIVGNGESVLPDQQPAHTAVRVFGNSNNPCFIVQSSICGNTGNFIGGVEIETLRPENVLWVHLVNSVVADNICTREFLEPERWDLSTNENSASTDPAGFVIINSIRTIDGPVFVDPGSNNYQPAPGSATIDAGDDSSVPADIFDLDNDGDTTEPVPFDAGGNPRFADAPGIPGSSVDIGAYEFQGTSCLADVNRDGMLSPTDFSAWVGAFNSNAPECDQNGDGMCTPTDFSAWVGNFNAGC